MTWEGWGSPGLHNHSNHPVHLVIHLHDPPHSLETAMMSTSSHPQAKPQASLSSSWPLTQAVSPTRHVLWLGHVASSSLTPLGDLLHPQHPVLGPPPGICRNPLRARNRPHHLQVPSEQCLLEGGSWCQLGLLGCKCVTSSLQLPFTLSPILWTLVGDPWLLWQMRGNSRLEGMVITSVS